MQREWHNWSGSLRFTPGRYADPEDEDEVRALVDDARQTGTTIRPVGSGHSSSPLVRTDGILLSLHRISGVLHHDVDEQRATLAGGTPLHDAGAGLYDAGLAMDNLGDIDQQTLAGATATGTHGTGVGFGNLSTQVVGVRLVTGAGEVLEISADSHPDLFPAARMSLGCLGVVTGITLALAPRYELRRSSWCMPSDWTLHHLDQLQHRNRNMDFYWYPRSDMTQIRILNEPGEQSPFHPSDEVRHVEHGISHHTIPRHRELRFEEIEYAMPSEAFASCFSEVRRRIKDRHRSTVGWRVLVRTVAADDIWLSSAYGRSITTIACLQNASLPYREYFEDMESVFRDHGGRPHWGKKHSLVASDLRSLYPEWDRFQAVRRRLDPDGVFLSPDLRTLLEER